MKILELSIALIIGISGIKTRDYMEDLNLDFLNRLLFKFREIDNMCTADKVKLAILIA